MEPVIEAITKLTDAVNGVKAAITAQDQNRQVADRKQFLTTMLVAKELQLSNAKRRLQMVADSEATGSEYSGSDHKALALTTEIDTLRKQISNMV